MILLMSAYEPALGPVDLEALAGEIDWDTAIREVAFVNSLRGWLPAVLDTTA